MAKKNQPTAKQIAEWKDKAAKWDKLKSDIEAFYFDDEGNELESDEGGDLADIGETAAIAFGLL
jgi:hypothetical protein